MAKIHVWMLYRGGPTEGTELKSYFQNQMQDPHLLGIGHGLLSRIKLWFISWWRGRDVSALQIPGPCPSHSISSEQSRELNRVLGADYRCHNVHRYDGRSAADRLKETPAKTTVLLLPLVPFRSGVLYSVLADARVQLEKQGIGYLEAPPLSRMDSYVEAYAETIREKIIELKGIRGYAILIMISRDALNWRRAEPKLEDEVQRFIDSLKQHLHPDVQIISALQDKEAIRRLEELRDTSHILYGYPAWTCDSYEELSSRVTSLPLEFHRIPNLNMRPSFIRTLAEVVWKHAPIDGRIA